MEKYRCCGGGCVGNAKASDMKVYAIALLDWVLPPQFAITPDVCVTCNHEEHSIEVELQELLGDSKFTAYREVFKTFGFGVRLEGIITTPNLPNIRLLRRRRQARGEKGARVESRESLLNATFHCDGSKSPAGLAPSLEASGDKSKIKIVGGSDLCRIAFWQWVFTRIEVKRCRLDNEIGAALGSQLDAEKAAGRPVRLVRSRISAKAAKLLFRELVKVLHCLEWSGSDQFFFQAFSKSPLTTAIQA